MNQEKIGKFIAELRKEKKLTQEELAEKVGVTDKSISRWENGKTMPDISLLSILAEELNTTIPELLNGSKMTKEETLKLKGTIENLIEYESSQQIHNSKKVNKYLLAGNIILLLAILNNQFSYLNLIFTSNIAEFVQGLMYGGGIVLEMIGIYNNSHDITIKEKKRQLINQMKNK